MAHVYKGPSVQSVIAALKKKELFLPAERTFSWTKGVRVDQQRYDHSVLLAIESGQHYGANASEKIIEEKRKILDRLFDMVEEPGFDKFRLAVEIHKPNDLWGRIDVRAVLDDRASLTRQECHAKLDEAIKISKVRLWEENRKNLVVQIEHTEKKLADYHELLAKHDAEHPDPKPLSISDISDNPDLYL